MKTRATLAIIVVSGLVLVSCGGSSGDSGASGSDSTVAASDSTAASGGSNPDSKFCVAAKDTTSKMETAFAGATDDPTSAKEGWQMMVSLVNDVVAKAPDEIRSAAETIKEGIAAYNDILEKYDYDFAKMGTDEAVAAELAKIGQDPKFNTANDEFTAYLESSCGIVSGS